MLPTQGPEVYSLWYYVDSAQKAMNITNIGVFGAPGHVPAELFVFLLVVRTEWKECKMKWNLRQSSALPGSYYIDTFLYSLLTTSKFNRIAGKNLPRHQRAVLLAFTETVGHAEDIGRFPKLWVPFWGVSHNKDDGNLGSILGYTHFLWERTI